MAEARAEHTWAAASSILAMIANAFRDPKKSRPFTPNDFNPLNQRATAKEDRPIVGIEVLKDVFIDGRMPGTGGPK